MKPSDVAWIGEIPSHWSVKRLKYTSNIVASYVDKHVNPDEIQVDLCNYTDVYYCEKIDSSINLMKGSCNQDEYERSSLNKGDVVITKDSESPDDIGVPAFIQEELTNVVCGYHLSIIRPENEVDGEFLFRFIQSNQTCRFFGSNSTGITRFSLGKSAIENLSILLPPLPEQTQIAVFLDHKTKHIDELIRVKERKIELLREQRTALINQAVTKGLDPNVEMKPSGVEWIGEIPAHWEVKRIKYLASLISKGTTPTTIGREILSDGEIRFIKGENIVNNQIELKPEYSIDEETNQMLKRSQLRENDLLFVIAGTIGKVSLVRPNHLPANTSQAISFIRPHKKELPEFIYYWLQSDYIQKIMWMEVVQSAQPNLSMEDLGNLHIPYPSIAEQCRIVDRIEDKTPTFVQLFQQAYKEIEFLREYRQSLISDAVTGKIDVRSEV